MESFGRWVRISASLDHCFRIRSVQQNGRLRSLWLQAFWRQVNNVCQQNRPLWPDTEVSKNFVICPSETVRYSYATVIVEVTDSRINIGVDSYNQLVTWSAI